MEELPTAFDAKLSEFLKKNTLNLEVPKRKESVETIKNSRDKTILGDYTITNDFPLATEVSKIALAYKQDSDQLLVAKEATEETIAELARLHNWGRLTVEEYLRRKGFNDPNVLLPVKIIKENGKVYRFYEAMYTDLEKYLETHRQLPTKESVALILRACQGVRSLHKAGIVNIDFAPLNIMLTGTSLKLIDLDSASMGKNDGTLLRRNDKGKNRFTGAPELFENTPSFDKTVDVYAVSSTLYRLIVGNWPYNIEKKTSGLSAEEKSLAYKKLHETGNIDFPDFIPQEIQKVIKRGMSPVPRNRYQSIQEFMSELMDATRF